MSIHILNGYIANLLRHLNAVSLNQINLYVDYDNSNQDYQVKQVAIKWNTDRLPQSFNAEDYLAEYYLDKFAITQLPHKIIIKPTYGITFKDFHFDIYHQLKLRLFDVDTPVFINDRLVSTSLKKSNWTFQDDFAYYLISTPFDQFQQAAQNKQNHYLKTLDYHLDKIVICNGENRADILDIQNYGCAGVVIPKKTMLVKRDKIINKQECPTWQGIHNKLSSYLTKNINAWQRGTPHPILSSINKTILYNELLPMQLTVYQMLSIMDAPLFNTAFESKLNILNLFQSTVVNIYLDCDQWEKRDRSELNYLIDCANFFDHIGSYRNQTLLKLLNTQDTKNDIFIELIEKYINTVSGCYKYNRSFNDTMSMRLADQREAFIKNIKMTHNFTWNFITNLEVITFEFSSKGLNKVTKSQTPNLAA